MALNLTSPLDLFNATLNETTANITALHIIPGAEGRPARDLGESRRGSHGPVGRRQGPSAQMRTLAAGRLCGGRPVGCRSRSRPRPPRPRLPPALSSLPPSAGIALIASNITTNTTFPTLLGFDIEVIPEP